MKRQDADIYNILELDYFHGESGAGVATARLKARIARRPGRWRQKMQSRRSRLDEEFSPYDEAA